MLIANPIYDVVFKYLLDDEESAKLLIGGILGEKILSLHPTPQENLLEIKREERAPLTVYRLDFAAVIELPDGDEKRALIEIQKAKFSSDLTRFRRYLGEQYRKASEPLITVYFLGHALERVDAPVIKVDRSYRDLATGERIAEREEFIESLTHDSYIIQIPFLKDHRRTDLEKMLTLFDQSRVSGDENAHFMNLDEEELPDKYRRLCRRLLRAGGDETLRRTMDVEDDVLAELMDKDRRIDRMERDIQAKDRTIVEKDQVLEKKDRLIAELTRKLGKQKINHGTH